MKKLLRFKWLTVPLFVLVVLIGLYLFYARFGGVKEKIHFTSDIEIEGMLLRPDTPGPHPAILLLHGAGDSHQEYDKSYFKFHANAFLEKGFAVLVYTKRGSGNNAVNYRYFTYKQLLSDAMAALKYLRSQEDIDQQAIGIMGVSESGWFTPEMANIDGNIKFIINRVSSPFSVTRTVIHERKMDALREGFTDEEVEQEIVPITKQIWQFYIDVYEDPSLANGPERDRLNRKMKQANADERLGQWFTSDQLNKYDSLLYASRGQNYSYDPLPYLKKINVPMLYVMGGKDINMPTKEIVPFLEKFRDSSNKPIDIKVYPEASHYLYKWGLEDGPYEGWLYQDGYMDFISGWASEQITPYRRQ